MNGRPNATVDYASAAPEPLGVPRLVIGLLCWSVPLVLAVFSFLAWMRSSHAVVGVMVFGIYLGLPSLPIGLLVVPRASRGRVLKWAWLPLLVSVGVIFGLGSSAEIA